MSGSSTIIALAVAISVLVVGCSQPREPATTSAPGTTARQGAPSATHKATPSPPPSSRSTPGAPPEPKVENPVRPVTPDDKAAFDAVGDEAEVGALLDFIAENPRSAYAARARHILEAKPIEHKHSAKYKDRASRFIPLQVIGTQPTRFVDCDPQKVGVRQKFAYQHRHLLLRGKPWSGRCPADVRTTYRFSNPSAHAVLLNVRAFGGVDTTLVSARSTVSGSVAGRGGCKATGTPTVAAGAKGPVLTFKDCRKDVDVELFAVEKSDVAAVRAVVSRATPNVDAAFTLMSERPLSEAALGLLDAYLDAHREGVDTNTPALVQGAYVLSQRRGAKKTLKVLRRGDEYLAWVLTTAKPWSSWSNFNPWPRVVVAYEGSQSGSLVRFSPTMATQHTAGHESGDFGGVGSRPEQTARPFSVRAEVENGKLVLLSGGQRWAWAGEVVK